MMFGWQGIAVVHYRHIYERNLHCIPVDFVYWCFSSMSCPSHVHRGHNDAMILNDDKKYKLIN